MTLAIAITFGVLLAVIAALMFTRVQPDMALLGALGLLIVTGVVPVADGLHGFANEGVATIGALFIVAEGLRQTGALNVMGQRMLGRPKTVAMAQLRMMVPIAGMSAFINNTPLVAMMMPLVSEWARKCRISVSQLLMPLSYASIFGGLITLIGTSTTLVVNGMLLDTPGARGLTMFELAWIGIPVTLIALAYVPFVSRWLLSDRKPATESFEDAREYTVEMMVGPTSPIVGRSIEEAGLRRLPGMYLAEVQRGDRVLPAVSPSTQIENGDRLIFVGVVESVIDLQRIPGLNPATDQLFKIDKPRSQRILVEAVVSSGCRFCGMSVREAKFRSYYNAVVIAVARHGERIRQKIGDIVLSPGDTLLLETTSSFVDVQRNSRDFFLVSKVPDSTPVNHERAWVARLLMLAMVITVTAGFATMFKASVATGILMVLTGCVRASQAKRALDLGVLLGVGAGLGIGAAMESSGAAELVAGALVGAVGGDPWWVLFAVFGVTIVLANLITTKAAAVLVFPIAHSTALSMGVDFIPYAIAIIVAAASAYATPVGYPTNLMVYSAGGYRPSDFLRLGGPLSLLTWAAAMIIIPLAWPF